MPRRENAVEKAYTAIFKDDPLLLETDNWSKYSDALLKHLLINRTVSSCEPYDININNPDSRQNFEEPLPDPLPAPASEIVDEYEKSIRFRKPNDAVFDEVAKVTMASDATFTMKRGNKRYLPHAKVSDDLKKRHKSSKIDDRLRIAVVGYRIKISKLVDNGYLGENLCRPPLRPEPEVAPLPDGPSKDQLRHTKSLSDQKQWEDTVLAHIKTALKQRSHIVLLPEFALPYANVTPAGTGKTIDDRICDLTGTAEIDTFVFAGTRHEGRYNRGLVVSKHGSRVDPWWHYKAASARKLGENVLGPKGVRMPTYLKRLQVKDKQTTFACTVAVCYDAFDISMFLNLIGLSVKSGQKWKHLVILVPSFNTSPDFVAMLRDLSFLARCMVVYVNGLHGDAKMFICGFAVSEIIDKRHAIVKRAAALAKELGDKLEAEEETFTARVSKDSGAQRTPEEEIQKSDWSDMQTALERIQSALSELNGSGGLDHLITIEALPPRKTDRTSITGTTPDDILYYNIDMGFLEALRTFRRNFFLGDKFLPTPFHYDELRKAFANRADADDAVASA